VVVRLPSRPAPPRADVALAEQEGALPIFEEPDRPKEVTH